MGSWLWWAWLQIWPNLAANIIWVPVAWAGGVWLKRHLVRHVDRRHQELAAHVTSAVEAATAKGD